jgi:hypothetical protein
MSPYTMEQSIQEGKLELKALFQYVEDNAEALDLYQIERGIKEHLNRLGLAACKCYFAKKGTGDIGDTIQVEDATVLKKQSRLCERILLSSFGKLKIPRTCYRSKARPAIMPLDAQANLPDKRYSYLVQEYMDILSIRNPRFEQSSEVLENGVFGRIVMQWDFRTL